MSVSNGLRLYKAVSAISNKQLTGQITQIRHHGQYMYRRGFAHLNPKIVIYGAEVMGAFTWWWILYHVWHQFDHLVGEFPYPESSKWTDAELGIPPDDYEE